jgi:hypothetical protein
MRARGRGAAVAVSVATPLFVVLAATDCYAPTEVTLTLSTDLDCSEDPRTRIYKGEPGRYETSPETEVTTCTPGMPEARIGTLVIIPSNGTDGSAAVKVVLARNGKAPADCDTDPTNCIIATRAFSFSAHASRRVPIRLLRDCLGTRCKDDETCVAGGKCIPNRVECPTDDCALPEEPPPPLPDGGRPPGDDGSTPVVDGDLPPDAQPDGTVVDGGDEDVNVPVPACVPSTGIDIITTTNEVPKLTAMGASKHFWVDDRSPVDVEVMQVAKKGPTKSSVFNQIAAPAGEKPFALAAQGDTALVAFGDGTSAAYAWNGSLYTAPAGITKVAAIAGIGAGRLAIAGQGSVQERTTVAAFRQLLSSAATSLVAADDYYFGATAAGITRIDPFPANVVTTPVAQAPQSALLATGTNGVVHAAAKINNTSWGIWRIASAVPSASLVIDGRAAITSLASDATHVYWTENNEIWRTPVSGGAAQKIFGQAGMSIDHVTLDAECLYFWTRRTGQSAALRLGPRKPFTSVGPGP